MSRVLEKNFIFSSKLPIKSKNAENGDFISMFLEIYLKPTTN
jgi:hypothetical protein